MSNVDQALQIMSDYWDAAYCEGSTGINQSANANDCLHRMRQLLQAHDGEVVAWRYTMNREDGSSVRLSSTEYAEGLSPFGRRGNDYSEEYEVTCEPLFTAPPRVVDVELLKMLVRIRDDKTWRTNDNSLWPDLLALIRKHEAALEQK